MYKLVFAPQAIEDLSKLKKSGNYSGTPDLTINIRKREAFATLI